MSHGWTGGSTRRWRKTRAVVLARDRYQCQLALPGTWNNRRGQTVHCRGAADCVHHLRGKQHGDDPRYLVAACTPCNLRIGDPTRTPDPKPTPITDWSRR